MNELTFSAGNGCAARVRNVRLGPEGTACKKDKVERRSHSEPRAIAKPKRHSTAEMIFEEEVCVDPSSAIERVSQDLKASITSEGSFCSESGGNS